MLSPRARPFVNHIDVSIFLQVQEAKGLVRLAIICVMQLTLSLFLHMPFHLAGVW